MVRNDHDGDSLKFETQQLRIISYFEKLAVEKLCLIAALLTPSVLARIWLIRAGRKRSHHRSFPRCLANLVLRVITLVSTSCPPCQHYSLLISSQDGYRFSLHHLGMDLRGRKPDRSEWGDNCGTEHYRNQRAWTTWLHYSRSGGVKGAVGLGEIFSVKGYGNTKA
jgi:hypothetical protein